MKQLLFGVMSHAMFQSVGIARDLHLASEIRSLGYPRSEIYNLYVMVFIQTKCLQITVTAES